MGLLFTSPMSFATVEGDTSTMATASQSMMADGIFNIYDHSIILILVGLATILMIANIFLFSNRTLQLRLNRIGMAAGILLILLAAIFFYQDYQMMDQGQYLISIEYGVLMPLLFIIFVALSSRFISKDEKIVRSMDRLR
jgi:hypothetical protein